YIDEENQSSRELSKESSKETSKDTATAKETAQPDYILQLTLLEKIPGVAEDHNVLIGSVTVPGNGSVMNTSKLWKETEIDPALESASESASAFAFASESEPDSESLPGWSWSAGTELAMEAVLLHPSTGE